MPRPMSTDMLAAIQSPYTAPALFVEMQFQSGTVYLWSGGASIAWNGQTWLGVGALLGISSSEDAATVDSRGVAVTLSGLDATLLPDCLNDFELGAPVAIYLGLQSSGALIASPLVTWAGRMDQPSIDVTGDAVTIAINCESRLIDMNVAVDRRYTDTDQQMQWPGDLCFQFVAGIQQVTLYWGEQANSTNNR